MLLALSFGGGPNLELRWAPQGAVLLSAEPLPGPDGSREGADRYFVGAAIDRAAADDRDRIVRLRLRRQGRGGEDSYGFLALELVPPRAIAVLAAEQSGRVLGVWPGAAAETFS